MGRRKRLPLSYGPENRRYLWLREAIASTNFQARGCAISAEEIFSSLMAPKCTAATSSTSSGEGNPHRRETDPVYPVYVDSKCDGRPHLARPRDGAVTAAAHLSADHRRQRASARPCRRGRWI